MRGWRNQLAMFVVIGGATGLWVVPAVALAQPTYVDLGDSYAAGVGTRVYYNDGTSCDRSPDAYGPLIAKARSYALSFEACNSATTTDVINNQLGPLNSSTNFVTITIGGNDAGFTTVIVDCAGFYFPCQSAINNANSFIQNQLPGALDKTYADIRSRAPNAHVLVLGYPHLFTSTGATCNFDALTSAHEKELNQTADLLDSVISARATAHGFTYVDPRNAFLPHEVCSSSEWLNGLSWPITDSFHPNVSGQAEFASLIEPVMH
jgi:lysophospholipase L1-like esterase